MSTATTLVSVVVDLATLAPLLAECERTADVVWLSRSCECDRYTLRGVPAKRIDVLVEHRLATVAGIASIDFHDRVVASITNKSGRFDGATRPRLVVRVVRGSDLVVCDATGHATGRIPSGRLDVEATPNGAHGSVRVTLSDVFDIRWDQTFARLRSDLGDYSPGRLIWWHARRYYGFLVEVAGDDVRALADSWQAPGEATLAEKAVAASRELYRLARDLRWRLPMRDSTAGEESLRSPAGYDGGLVIDEVKVYQRWPDADCA